MNPEKIVRDFCAAASRRDAAELAAYFSDDAVYHNIPVDPVRGPEAIRKVLESFLGPASNTEFEIRGLAVQGRLVLTERIDRFVVNGKPVVLPVMGAFEVRPDGNISAWRDYFDLAQFTKQLA
jgi:limonene-1,2-epoxide hydrolase